MVAPLDTKVPLARRVTHSVRELGAQRGHLVQLDRAVEAPRELGGGGDAVEVEVAPQQRLGLDAAGADERDELGELGGVRVLVPLRERELRGRGEEASLGAAPPSPTLKLSALAFSHGLSASSERACWIRDSAARVSLSLSR